MHSWDLRNDPIDGADSFVVVVSDGDGTELICIGAEELIGDLGPRYVLQCLKDRLVARLDDPAEYSLAHDIVGAMEVARAPSRQPKQRRHSVPANTPN